MIASIENFPQDEERETRNEKLSSSPEGAALGLAPGVSPGWACKERRAPAGRHKGRPEGPIETSPARSAG